MWNISKPCEKLERVSGYLQAAFERLKGVQIENLDALELIRRYDTSDVFILFRSALSA